MQQPQVKVGDGTYEGLWADDAKSIQVFKGIAYAAPPVGPLRFRPPAPGPKLTGIIPAQTDPTACWQAHSEEAFVWSLGVFPRSEDCLYLNVWTPGKSRASGAPLPVMVWFHGGGHRQSWGASSTIRWIELRASRRDPSNHQLSPWTLGLSGITHVGSRVRTRIRRQLWVAG